MAKFSDMLPEERKRKEYLIKTIFKLSQLRNFKCVVDTVDNFIDFQNNSRDSMWLVLIFAVSSKMLRVSTKFTMDCIVVLITSTTHNDF